MDGYSVLPSDLGGDSMKRSLLFSCVLCLLIGLLIGVLLPVDWSPEKPATVDTGTMTFSTLDSYLKWQVELELSDLLSAFSGPVIFVTHNRDEVQRLCQQVCVLDQGRSQSVLPVKELFEAPRTLSACLLSGCKNISRARATAGGKVEALDWGVTLEPGRPLPEGLSHIGMRAHYIRPVDGPGPNRLPCTVERVVENVFSTVVMLSTPGGSQGFSRLRIELEKGRWSELTGKDPLWLELPARDLLLLTQDR